MDEILKDGVYLNKKKLRLEITSKTATSRVGGPLYADRHYATAKGIRFTLRPRGFEQSAKKKTNKKYVI